jgi:hypothetical protein
MVLYYGLLRVYPKKGGTDCATLQADRYLRTGVGRESTSYPLSEAREPSQSAKKTTLRGPTPAHTEMMIHKGAGRGGGK